MVWFGPSQWKQGMRPVLSEEALQHGLSLVSCRRGRLLQAGGQVACRWERAREEQTQFWRSTD